MKRVVERCPNCGVEHDDPVGGECEVCGTQLRYWCRVHGPEIGFMDTAACPRCAAEAARPVPPPRAPAPPRAPVPPPPSRAPRRPAPTRVEPDAPPRTVPPPRTRPRWGGREPRVVIRDGAEDLAPYAASFAVRLLRAFFALVRTVVGWTILGAIAGGVYASYVGADVFYTAAFGAMIAAGLGLVIGGLRALLILFGPSPPD